MGKSTYVTAAASIGLAYTDVTYDETTFIYDNGIATTESSYVHAGTVGVPFEVSVFFTPVRYFGIGIMLMGNANSEASYVGGLLGLQFGKLR